MIRGGAPEVTVHSIKVGSITVEVAIAYGPRKSLQISVTPERQVKVLAPNGTPLEVVLTRLNHRGGWVVRQLEHFRRFPPAPAPRRYVSGETHRYLGRQYRLKVIPGEPEGVKLTRGYFQVLVKNSGDSRRVEHLLNEWFSARARIVLAERLERCTAFARYFDIPAPTTVSFRRMAKRWGSCTKEGRIILNTDLIHVPTPCIDYVITHELCHLKHPNHSPAFYGLLKRIMPDWQRRKERLEQALQG